MTPSVTFSIDADAVGWIVFDAPGARANVFNAETQQAFADALAAAEVSAARAVVITGAKERIFIAGADLHWLQDLRDRDEAQAFARAGQLLFQRVADLRVPTVCAIHGACAGGGFELALACNGRIASRSPATQLGLPETSVGTIPGWGGSVRLPRLIGVERALEHILRGQLIGADAALDAGLVDELVAPADLRARAKALALEWAATGRPRRVLSSPARTDIFEHLREAAIARTHGHQPAPLAAIDVVRDTAELPVAAALEIEARYFAGVTAGEVCRNLIHAFFLRDAAKKRSLEGWFEDQPVARATKPIRKVGVVGAGVMGSGIAHWLATRGFDVVLRDVQSEFIERALAVIRNLLDDGVRKGTSTASEAGLVWGRIRTTTSWEGFADCDLVVEAIVEDVAAKRALFSELAQLVGPDAILASNTSALPIDEIAGHVGGPERTIGIHFFNPVSRMPLVELVLAGRTSAGTAARALELVRTLGKSPVICRSSPGFLVTRVLFFYVNAAVRLWEQGAETTAIDRAMRGFGWPMGPLRLIDEVGVDVTAFIFSEMAHYFPERFTPTVACQQMLAAGLKGRKNGAGRGFYTYAGGGEAPNKPEARRAAGIAGSSGLESPAADKIVETLMSVMADEARRCLAERVVRSRDDVDFALLTGAGFPAFRGGLLRWAEANAG